MATARIPIPPHPAGSRVDGGVVRGRVYDPRIWWSDWVIDVDKSGVFRGSPEDGGEVVIDGVSAGQRVNARIYDCAAGMPTMSRYYRVVDDGGSIEQISTDNLFDD